jgi:hypothetical protein
MNHEKTCLRKVRAAYSILVAEAERENDPCEITGVSESRI